MPHQGVSVKARSLVFDLFGDYLRYRGGEARLRTLTALMACFDVPEPTVRVVVARLRKEGWLRVAPRRPRDHLRAHPRRVATARRRPCPHLRPRRRDHGTGSGTWSSTRCPRRSAALREQLRKKLAWLGFGALSASVWLSPHDRIGAVRASLADQSGGPARRLPRAVRGAGSRPGHGHTVLGPGRPRRGLRAAARRVPAAARPLPAGCGAGSGGARRAHAAGARLPRGSRSAIPTCRRSCCPRLVRPRRRTRCSSRPTGCSGRRPRRSWTTSRRSAARAEAPETVTISATVVVESVVLCRLPRRRRRWRVDEEA